jgi:DNA-binding response OmpR family regulator
VKILIVDDNADAVKLLRMQLDKAGYETAWAHETVGARKVLEEDGVDALVLDVGLPGISGLSLLEALHADVRFDTLPVIIATGKDLDLLGDAVNRPGVRLLVKPHVGLAEIEQALRELGLGERMPKRGGL